jgi:hypothetical protein
MSESLRFPPQEAAPAYVELNDILKEQIRMYSEPSEMQTYIDNCLEVIHGNSNLGYALDVYAEGLAIYYARFEGRGNEHRSFKRMFYAGSILATEVAMSGLPDGASDRFHHFQQDEIESEYSDDPEGKNNALAKLSELADIDEAGLEENDKTAIETAALLYAPQADAVLQGFFSLGYRFGSMSACTLCEYYYPDLNEAS